MGSAHPFDNRLSGEPPDAHQSVSVGPDAEPGEEGIHGHQSIRAETGAFSFSALCAERGWRVGSPAQRGSRSAWMPADIHGRSIPGQAYCGAGSPGRYLASEKRGIATLNAAACCASLNGVSPAQQQDVQVADEVVDLYGSDDPNAGHAAVYTCRDKGGAHRCRRVMPERRSCY